MEIFKKKSLILKIVIALVVVILFNFSAPTISQAGVAEVIGGTLAEPVADLLLAIADGAVYVVQNLLFGMDVSLLKVAVPDAGVCYAKSAFLMGSAGRGACCQFLGFGTCLWRAFRTTHKEAATAPERFRQFAMQSKNHVPKRKYRENVAGDFLLNPCSAA